MIEADTEICLQCESTLNTDENKNIPSLTEMGFCSMVCTMVYYGGGVDSKYVLTNEDKVEKEKSSQIFRAKLEKAKWMLDNPRFSI